MNNRYRISLLATLFILTAASLLRAQPSVDSAAKRLVLRDKRLFDSIAIRRDTTFRRDETHPLPEHLPGSWSPEFPTNFARRPLLKMEDSPPFLLNYDRADGFFLGVGDNLPATQFLEKRIQGYFGFGYAFGSHYWQVYGGLSRDFLSTTTPLRIGGEGHILTDTRDAWKVERFENSLDALLAGVDSRDYYQRKGYSLSIEQFLSPRIGVRGEFRSDRYINSRREVGWSLFGPKQPFRDVQGIQEGRLTSAAVGLVMDFMSLRSWSETEFGLETEAEWGSLDGRFAQYVLDLRLKTVAIDPWLSLAVHGRVGSATGAAPLQKLFTIGGWGTLPGYPQNAYQGNRMALLQTDLLIAPFADSRFLHNLRVIFSNDFGAVTTADSAAGPLAGIPTDPALFLYSPGIYVGTPAGQFRIGYAFRTDIFRDPRLIIRLNQVF
ncbi:MAG: hypothetical protein JWQ98_3424 [Chlorobi bacterium]|nr:hypothetical protein [Chlorobiota bacterium]